MDALASSLFLLGLEKLHPGEAGLQEVQAAKDRLVGHLAEAETSFWKDHFCHLACEDCFRAACKMMRCDRCTTAKPKAGHSCGLWSGTRWTGSS